MYIYIYPYNNTYIYVESYIVHNPKTQYLVGKATYPSFYVLMQAELEALKRKHAESQASFGQVDRYGGFPKKKNGVPQ